MQFRDPILLTLALLAPLALAWSLRTGSAARYSSLEIPNRAARSWRSRLSAAPAVMTALALLCLSVALAGPRTPDAQTKVSRRGIAIMLVVDRSGSMHARDLVRNDTSVDRLEVVKDVVRRFILGDEEIAGRPDDQIGLIAFAGYADSLCPLTLDHGNLVSMVEDLEIVRQREEDGTAIGEGLALAVERLRRSKAASKVAILLTDGVNNAGAIDPLKAAELAAGHDIKVYCIGAGSEGLAPFPSVDPFTGRATLRPMMVEIDEETLKEIADKTSGRYFRATDRERMQEIYAEIDRLERTEISEMRYLEYTEHYGSFVAAALGLMSCAAVAGASIFRTLP